jgi:hypothetical protein
MTKKPTVRNKVKQNKNGSVTAYNKSSDGKWKKAWGGKSPKK